MRLEQDVKQDAKIGASVRVRGDPGLASELQSQKGTVSAKWGNPWGATDDLILEVRLDDGRTRLFWNHELEWVVEGA